VVSFFLSGLTDGFRIGYNPHKSAKRNLACALEHLDVVNQYLTEELIQGHMAGPYNIGWAPYLQIWSHT